MLTAVLGAPPANAFGRHDRLTTFGLSNSPRGVSFLRPAVLQAIHRQNNWMDGGIRKGEDERHFDDCEFNGAAEFIRDRYQGARRSLIALDPWAAASEFGQALHPAQDFYSHSNWVELGFPLGDNEATVEQVEGLDQSDLVDLSGAQSSLAQSWSAPSGGAVVRNDILLGGDDWEGIPYGWSISRNGPPGRFVRFVPTLIDPQGNTRGRLLVSGQSEAPYKLPFDDSECDVPFKNLPLNAYTGITHKNLNKDGPTSGQADLPDEEKRKKYYRAYALAKLQTGYEWCRLVRQASVVDRDGLLLAMWVKAGGNPHPPDTPCRPASPGPRQVTVTIESIRILDDGDQQYRDRERGTVERSTGEIQLAAVLYDDRQNFNRSVHATNRSGSMKLHDGDFVPSSQLPPPLTLCVDRGASFALHAWDNDDPLGDQFALDFDNVSGGPNNPLGPDTLLVGFRRDFGPQLPSGVQSASSDDLDVRFRVTRSAPGQVVSSVCPQEQLRTR
jgi:hypothetical protein